MKSHAGFTLIEIMIGMSLSVLLGTLLVGIAFDSYQALEHTRLTRKHSSAGLESVATSITNQARLAMSATDNQGKLQLKVPSRLTTGEIDSTKLDTFEYYFDPIAQTLTETVEPAEGGDCSGCLYTAHTTTIAENVTAFSYTTTSSGGKPLISVNLTLTITNPFGGTVSQTYRRNWVGRNG